MDVDIRMPQLKGSNNRLRARLIGITDVDSPNDNLTTVVNRRGVSEGGESDGGEGGNDPN